MIIMLLSQTEAVQFFIDNRNFAFFIVYPVYLTGSMRAIIVLLVEVDRAVATCFPILFYKYRKLIPPILFIALTLVYALIDLFTMFIYCGDSIDVPPGCISIMCALSICYRTYWLAYEKISYALTMVFALVLCSRLFFMNKMKESPNDDLKRANRLALIDIVIIIVFDINPSLIMSFFPNFWQPMGPINSFFKTATYFPIIHFKHRKSIPTFLIVFFTLFYALFDILVMFIYCGDRIDVPPGCTNVVCGLSKCYRNYWVNYEKFINISIIITSLLLSFKLFVMNYKKVYINNDLKKVNQLALIFTGIIVVFSMTPSNVMTFIPDFYTYLGPVTAFFKTMGMIVEGYFISKSLSKRRTKKPSQVVTAMKAFKISSSGF
ncbi:unnamed protein product [Caenorhabditis nigoni]